MKISDIKKEMLAWEDFFGRDIMFQDDIKKSKNKEQLSEIMDMYVRHIEDTCNDAIHHCEEFKKKLGL